MGDSELVKQVAHIACVRCKGQVFQVGVAIESGEFMVRCTVCRKPVGTGAKLSSEAHRKMLHLRAAGMAASDVVN